LRYLISHGSPEGDEVIDPERPFRDQDPLDQNARSGAEGSGVGAWDLELSTRRLSWSTATRKLFGVGPDAPVDYDLFLSLLDAQDRDRAARAVQESIDTGCNFDVQYRVHRDSDQGHWVRAVGTTINGPDGVPARLSGIMIDINPRNASRKRSGRGRGTFARFWIRSRMR
jgi:two-component system, LuxR family, sensor kinase FixL